MTDQSSNSASGHSSMSTSNTRHTFSRPNYMTVGNGSTSENASRLAAILDNDSGYGGSNPDSEATLANSVFAPEFHDTFIPKDPSDSYGDSERHVVASHVHQLYYNQNRTALARAITKTVDTLKRLQDVNAKWPAHYPSVQKQSKRPDLNSTASTYESSVDSRSSTHALQHTPKRPSPIKRAETSTGESSTQHESAPTLEKNAVQEPRLVSPQLARDFSVLKIDLKMGHLSQTELVHSLEKSSISALLDGQINTTIRHLQSLRERIEDTSSKVLVTGDLNAGKSTFCNALLRRKILPEDQQPCTSIFCEVLDVSENSGLEEVHAVPNGIKYNRNDERTYSIFKLDQLEQVVVDNDKWSQCKIYIKDVRTVDESLLNNGVVDIALIDAPGLNHDSIITTANFAKQEEIDVVIFVVSAANHFTQSAKEFVFNAAREKAYIFMVVNGFDNIRDKERCKEMILKQVGHLSPDTLKEADELVHFVSSNDIPMGQSSSSSVSGSGPGGDGNDNDGDDDDDPIKRNKGKGPDKQNLRDFAELEASLRRFVLEKRARSKLAPAKRYILNLTNDLDHLANVNNEVAQSELDRVAAELKTLEPQLEESKRATNDASDGTDNTIEDTVTEVYNNTREKINQIIDGIDGIDLGIEYPGFFNVYTYAEDLKQAMLEEIAQTVTVCEDYARDRTVTGVNAIKSLGIMHLGNTFPEFNYRPENMFRRKKDILARQVDVDVEFLDFFDVSGVWDRQDKVASTSMAVTVAGVVGTRLIGGSGWMDGVLGVVKIMGVNNTRKLIVPGIVATILIAAAYAITSIPNSLPKRLSSKLSTQLALLDYTHSNASRISAEVRRALKFPADTLRVGLKRNFEQLKVKKEETLKAQSETDIARKYFINLIREAGDITRTVRNVDLEGPLIAAASS